MNVTGFGSTQLHHTSCGEEMCHAVVIDNHLQKKDQLKEYQLTLLATNKKFNEQSELLIFPTPISKRLCLEFKCT